MVGVLSLRLANLHESPSEDRARLAVPMLLVFGADTTSSRFVSALAFAPGPRVAVWSVSARRRPPRC
jgi:hypothetical protein